jgi:cupin fold WbuC family metalloprotein
MFNFKIDQSGKSSALFVKNDRALSISDLNILIKMTKDKREDHRLCLHNSKKSKLHVMVNCLIKKKNVILQAHSTKDEFYYIIKGKLKINIYSGKKKIINKIILGKKNKFYFLKKKIIHSTIALSKICIFLECRTGPFDSKDTVYY